MPVFEDVDALVEEMSKVVDEVYEEVVKNFKRKAAQQVEGAVGSPAKHDCPMEKAKAPHIDQGVQAHVKTVQRIQRPRVKTNEESRPSVKTAERLEAV